MWDLHFRTWKRPLSEHYLKAEYGGRKYCSKTSHLFLCSSGLLPRSHNFFENVIADAEEEKLWYKLLPRLITCWFAFEPRREQSSWRGPARATHPLLSRCSLPRTAGRTINELHPKYPCWIWPSSLMGWEPSHKCYTFSSGIQTCKLAHWKCDLTRK